MDYSYILNTSLPQKEKLLDFGFSEAGGSLVLKKEIAGGQFYAESSFQKKRWQLMFLKLRQMKSMYYLTLLLHRGLLLDRFVVKFRI